MSDINNLGTFYCTTTIIMTLCLREEILLFLFLVVMASDLFPSKLSFIVTVNEASFYNDI